MEAVLFCASKPGTQIPSDETRKQQNVSDSTHFSKPFHALCQQFFCKFAGKKQRDTIPDYSVYKLSAQT
jgi:hypothetical protein